MSETTLTFVHEQNVSRWKAIIQLHDEYPKMVHELAVPDQSTGAPIGLPAHYSMVMHLGKEYEVKTSSWVFDLDELTIVFKAYELPKPFDN